MKSPTKLAVFSFAFALQIAHGQTASADSSPPVPEPAASAPSADEAAELTFSSDKKYETKNGVPLKGTPYLCSSGSVSKAVGDGQSSDRVTVKANEEIAVTSVVSWNSTGFRLTCAKFVSFTPEKNGKYVVVNERIGGKGWSAMWSAPARQTCQVSVYKETPSGFVAVETQPTAKGSCRAPEV